MQYLMNPHTGSIDTLINWQSDFEEHLKDCNGLDPKGEACREHTWESWSQDLVEVTREGEEIK